MKRIIIIIITIILLVGCEKKAKNIEDYFDENLINIEQLNLPVKGEEIAIVKTTKGDMKIRLFKDIAPLAVENFITLAKEGYYDGYGFSRIEDNFCIQIGGNTEYPHGKSIYGDFYDLEIDSEYHNFFGAIGVARTAEKKNSSLFYIISREDLLEEDIEFLENNETSLNKEEVYAYKAIGGVPRLDYEYTIFGQVYEGLDILINISKTPINKSTNEILERIFINEIIFKKIK